MFFRRFFSLIILLLVIAGCLAFPAVRSVVLRLFSPLAFWSEEASLKIFLPLKTLGGLSKLPFENKKLEEENLTLQSEVSRLKEVAVENNLLKQELKFNEPLKKNNPLAAKIIGRSPLGSFGSWLLDRGRKDGMQVGQLVVTQGYLVGKIKDVYDGTSQMELITSPRILIPVVLSKSRASGLLKGGLQGLVIEEIPLDVQVEKDEEVLTTSFDKDSPEGIVVGKVKQVEAEKGAIFQKVLVETPLNFSQMEYVSVMTKS